VPTNNPIWQAPRDSTAACGSCHGLPPAVPHPQSKDCFKCHGSVIDQNRQFVNKKLHINGQVDTANLACNSCHGTDPNTGGPPPDLEGNTTSDHAGVGAHQNHLTAASATHDPVACKSCHVVPPDTRNHPPPDAGPPATITFDDLATHNNSKPVYDSSTHQCSNTYCHQFYSPSNNPIWQAPRDSTAACGSCHGLPPALPHPQNSNCSQCHAAVVDANRNFVNKSLHINGHIDTGTACNSCHGTDPNGGPPPDLEGNTTSDHTGVGAHQNHLTPSATHDPVACNSCHVVPTDTSNHPSPDAGPPATITFGGLSTNNNSTPVYNSSTHQCSNTYCHQFYSPSNNPIWQAPRDSTVACGSCHALPPPFVANTPISAQSHPKVNKATDCYRCHGMVVDSNLSFIASQLHVNGTIDYQLTCSSCHGSTASFAPPTDLAGNTAVTSLGVGAHQKHLTGGLVSRPVPCYECHVVPTNVNDPGHIDDWGTAEVTFSGAAIKGGHLPIWNRQTASCTDSWCHGPVTAGNVSPMWIDPSVTITCTSCHGFPPPDPHPQVAQNPLVVQCFACHTNVTQSYGFVDRNLHVNGIVDF
jgi:predicted CxxxxCH...CXXCH cytochrome family protein